MATPVVHEAGILVGKTGPLVGKAQITEQPQMEGTVLCGVGSRVP